MNYQMNFKRYELKYVMTKNQKELALEAMEPYMALDQYGRSAIRNIYYDTNSYRLIRRSIERPAYKEKLRARSYGKAGAQEMVFIELKKKYQSIVYKRRIALPQEQAFHWLSGKIKLPFSSQITKEIEYFRDYYQTLGARVFLSYEREAYYSCGGDDFRVTFDENILSREESLSLETDAFGTPLLLPGTVLMELKTTGGIPLWMTHFLAKEKLFKTSFSKYGTAYQKMILGGQEGEKLYA